MVVYSVCVYTTITIIVDLSPTTYFLPNPLLVYGSMLLSSLSTSILSSYSDLRKSYSVYVGVGLGIAHDTCLNARKRLFVLADDSEYLLA